MWANETDGGVRKEKKRNNNGKEGEWGCGEGDGWGEERACVGWVVGLVMEMRFEKGGK